MSGFFNLTKNAASESLLKNTRG